MSNSGLVLDGDTALLIDTQFDLPPARTMLDALVDQVPNARIDVLVNTHADGDHTWGNQLVPGAQLTVSTDTAKEMAVAPTPADLLALLELPTGDPLGDYMTDLNQPFNFTGITPPSPARWRSPSVAPAPTRCSSDRPTPAATQSSGCPMTECCSRATCCWSASPR
jgi:hypothetical protein